MSEQTYATEPRLYSIVNQRRVFRHETNYGELWIVDWPRGFDYELDAQPRVTAHVERNANGRNLTALESTRRHLDFAVVMVDPTYQRAGRIGYLVSLINNVSDVSQMNSNRLDLVAIRTVREWTMSGGSMGECNGDCKGGCSRFTEFDRKSKIVN